MDVQGIQESIERVDATDRDGPFHSSLLPEHAQSLTKLSGTTRKRSGSTNWLPRESKRFPQDATGTFFGTLLGSGSVWIWRAANLGRSRLLGGQSRLKAGCGQNCPPSKSTDPLPGI